MGLALFDHLFRRYTGPGWSGAPRLLLSDTDQSLWEGPDDLWPDKDEVPMKPSEKPRLSKPESSVIQQWGVKLPDGVISWGVWQGIPLDQPMDRMRLIATLQKTAVNIGFTEVDQLADFLSHYTWVVREVHVTTRFCADTLSYPLDDPAAAEITTNGQVKEVPHDAA